MERPPTILTIAGSDSGGGAGIQADLKTIAVLGGYGVTAITALTAQNSLGVQAVHPVPASFVARQMDSIFSDLRPRAAKTGMLATAEIIEEVAGKVAEWRVENLVVDPVMISTTGDRLIDEGAVQTLVKKLFPRALIITPNLHEASALLGRNVTGRGDMERAARELYQMGPAAVLVKGGHLEESAADYYFDGDEGRLLEGARIPTLHTHGSGCVLSAAIATGVGRGLPLAEAVVGAKKFITGAISGAFPVGGGIGPVNPLAAGWSGGS